MRPHVSYSELSEFVEGCQWRWKLNYLEGLRSSIYSIHFDFGTAIHEAMEILLKRKDPCTTEFAVEHFITTLQKLYAANNSKYDKPFLKDDLEILLFSGKRIIEFIKSCPELQGVDFIHNELALFESIDRTDEIDIKFKGFIDIVIKGKDKRGNPILWVCDFKTCTWGWGVETRQDRWKQFQLFLYKHYLCKKYDLDPKNVRCAFILLKKRPAKGADPVEFFPVSAGPVSVQRALDALNGAITEMSEHSQTGKFKKNKNHCIDKFGGRCPFLGTAHCPDD